MPLVQAARNKREWLKTVAILGLSIILVTAVFGALVGAPASLLAGIVGSRRAMSQVMQVTLIVVGVLMIVVALGEMGLMRRFLPEIRFSAVPTGEPRDAGSRNRYRQAVVLGVSMAATFGTMCPKPLYLALLVYIAAVGNMLFGALALGAYGLGLAASMALISLVLLPAGRTARLHGWLRSQQEAFHLVQGFVFALVGTMSVAFFLLRYVVAPD
jgi:cytochrome c biogenesis protein CcdA